MDYHRKRSANVKGEVTFSSVPNYILHSTGYAYKPNKS